RRKTSHLQPFYKMARAGIEPATPRFSGTGCVAARRRKSPANRHSGRSLAPPRYRRIPVDIAGFWTSKPERGPIPSGHRWLLSEARRPLSQGERPVRSPVRGTVRADASCPARGFRVEPARAMDTSGTPLPLVYRGSDGSPGGRPYPIDRLAAE